MHKEHTHRDEQFFSEFGDILEQHCMNQEISGVEQSVKEFAEYLRAAREQKNLSVPEFGDASKGSRG